MWSITPHLAQDLVLIYRNRRRDIVNDPKHEECRLFRLDLVAE